MSVETALENYDLRREIWSWKPKTFYEALFSHVDVENLDICSSEIVH